MLLPRRNQVGAELQPTPSKCPGVDGGWTFLAVSDRNPNPDHSETCHLSKGSVHVAARVSESVTWLHLQGPRCFPTLTLPSGPEQGHRFDVMATPGQEEGEAVSACNFPGKRELPRDPCRLPPSLTGQSFGSQALS